jgi:hypothetical protein
MTVEELIKVLEGFSPKTVVSVQEYDGREDLARPIRIVEKLDQMDCPHYLRESSIRNRKNVIILSAWAHNETPHLKDLTDDPGLKAILEIAKKNGVSLSKIRRWANGDQKAKTKGKVRKRKTRHNPSS